MKKLTDKELDVWISEDMFLDFNQDTQHVVRHARFSLSYLDSDESEFVRLYSGHFNLPRVAILHAHGGHNGKEWLYYDDKKAHRISSWLQQRDGQYGLIILWSCNTGSMTPPSLKKSLLLLPDQVVGQAHVSEGSCHLSLIHPMHGELDYTLGYYLKELKSQMKT